MLTVGIGLCAGIIYFLFWPEPARFPEPVYCTQDAMQCPDDTWVGRTGPNCEFVCPSSLGLTAVRGYVHIGPTCPVIRVGYEEECQDRPYSVSIEVHYPNEKLYTIIKSDEVGVFSVNLPAGEYILRPQLANILPACEEKRITVIEGKTLEVDISCDSGIR